MDLLQIGCIGVEPTIARQTIKQPISRQGGLAAPPWLFSALIAKSRNRWEEVGELMLLCCNSSSLRGLAGRPSSTASEVKVPIQPLCCCCDTISKHRSTAPAAKPRNVCQAVTSSCQKLSSCPKLSPEHPFTPPLSTIYHQAVSPKPLASSLPLKHLRRNNRIFDTVQ